MKTDELAIVALLLAVGIVVGFAAWTYISPMLNSTALRPTA